MWMNLAYNKILVMGNKQSDKHNQQFLKAVSQMRNNRNETNVEKVATHLEERYREHLIDSLRKQEMSKNIKKLLADCIEKKIKKQDLTSTIAVLNSLRSTDAEQLLKPTIPDLKKAPSQSKNVVVKFDNRKTKINRIPTEKKTSNTGYLAYRQEDTLEGRIKHTGQFICKEFNQSYHPFRILCKRFADILGVYEEKERVSDSEAQFEEKQELQRKTVKEFCQFLVAGCAGIYKKWIIEYTGLEDRKYEKWMYSLVLNQIWGVNDGYMLGFMVKVIRKTRIPLQIDFEGLLSCSTLGLLQPKDFQIDSQLQIQGNYLISIFQMSSLGQQTRPTTILKTLQQIKNSICIDIDNYHKLYQKGQIYQINADNIVGIVAYILSRIPMKIQQLSIMLLFLRMIYGEGIYYNMDTSSYMYSTIWAAIQFFQSHHFQEVKKNQCKDKDKDKDQVREISQLQNQSINVDKMLKDTSCVSSFVSEKNSGTEKSVDKGKTE